MDIETNIKDLMSEHRMLAGAEFTKALMKLGFDALLMGWAYDVEAKAYRFVIISNWAKIFGSVEIYKRLLQAYGASALPGDVTPLMVDVYAPDTVLAQRILPLFKSVLSQQLKVGAPGQKPVRVQSIKDRTGELEMSSAWIFHINYQKRDSMAERRKFRNFEEKIESLAA